MSYIDALKRWEGSKNWLYLDTRGYVTTGIGNLVRTAGACLLLPWRNIDGTVPSDEWVTAEWRRVDNAPKGHKAEWYQTLTTIRLSDEAVDNLAETRLQSEFLPALRILFHSFDDYPVSAKEALVDMVYNLGAGGLAKFSHLRKACDARDWEKASRACHVATSREDRNAWRLAQFASAVNGAVPTTEIV